MVPKLVALVLPLGLDTFAVAAALGLTGVRAEARLRVSLTFTSFEAVMPLVGLALGASLGRAIGGPADYLAIAVLLAVGLHALLESGEPDNRRFGELARPYGRSVLLLGLSVSLDELAIGFTLGLLHVPTLLVIVLIATQAFILTQLGLTVGGQLGRRSHELAERLAGVALATLAIALLAEKLLG